MGLIRRLLYGQKNSLPCITVGVFCERVPAVLVTGVARRLPGQSEAEHGAIRRPWTCSPGKRTAQTEPFRFRELALDCVSTVEKKVVGGARYITVSTVEYVVG